MRSCLFLVAALAFSCSKSSNEGLPSGANWGATAKTQPGATDEPPPPPPTTGIVPMEGTKTQGGGLPPGHPPVQGSGQPDDHPPVVQKTPPKTLVKLADGKLALGPYALAVPEGWSETPTTSEMRSAQFAFGAAPDAGELVVYYFGKEGAGSKQANIDRWVGQISGGTPKIEKSQVLGQEATIVTVTGHYQAMAMPGATEAVDKQDQTMMAAITESPDGPYYWKLVGSKATVAANDAKFRGMLTSLKLK